LENGINNWDFETKGENYKINLKQSDGGKTRDEIGCARGT
jgi:hypothetical protein